MLNSMMQKEVITVSVPQVIERLRRDIPNQEGVRLREISEDIPYDNMLEILERKNGGDFSAGKSAG